MKILFFQSRLPRNCFKRGNEEIGLAKDKGKNGRKEISKIMKVSLDEIKSIFNDLIEEKKSREQVAFWASQRQFENDANKLEFELTYEKKKIWRGITYLMGVDLRDMDGDYLHSTENFIEFIKNEM